jgi:hypothetical protein
MKAVNPNRLAGKERCGSEPVYVPPIMIKSNNISDAEFAAFVKTNIDHYAAIWKRFKEKRSCFLGFFAGNLLWTCFWLVYRKMYLETIGFILSFAVLDNLLAAIYKVLGFKLPFIIISLSNTILNLALFGTFQNYVYIKFVERNILKLKKKYGNSNDLIAKLHNKGGTSLISLISFTIIFAAYLLLAIYAYSHTNAAYQYVQ